MRLLFSGCVLLALLVGCETHQPVVTTPAPPQVAAIPPAPVVSLRPVTRSLRDTVDVSSLYYDDVVNAALLDTVLRLGTHRYRLLLQAQADSTRPLGLSHSHSAQANGLAGDSSAGPALFPDVRYRITLLDSAGHRVFRQLFTKPSFYRPLGEELVLKSIPRRLSLWDTICPASCFYFGRSLWSLIRT